MMVIKELRDISHKEIEGLQPDREALRILIPVLRKTIPAPEPQSPNASTGIRFPENVTRKGGRSEFRAPFLGLVEIRCQSPRKSRSPILNLHFAGLNSLTFLHESDRLLASRVRLEKIRPP